MQMDSSSREYRSVIRYDHAHFETRRRFLRFLIKNIGFALLAKLNQVQGLENIPENGPALLMMNHIAFIDPLLVIHVMPRHIVPLAKIEVYKYPVVGIFPRIWGVIPVQRQTTDRHAIKQVMGVLQAGEIVLVAPEGTRGPQLRRGKEGVAYLASRSDVPVIPIAIEGTEGFPALRFTTHWRSPGACVKIGNPFRFRPEFRRADRDQLRMMTDEAMYILASLLPEGRRGAYKDLSQATRHSLEFL